MNKKLIDIQQKRTKWELQQDDESELSDSADSLDEINLYDQQMEIDIPNHQKEIELSKQNPVDVGEFD